MAKFCSECGARLIGSGAFCSECGAKSGQPLVCACGEALPANARFCPGCGSDTGSPQGRTVPVAAIEQVAPPDRPAQIDDNDYLWPCIVEGYSAPDGIVAWCWGDDDDDAPPVATRWEMVRQAWEYRLVEQASWSTPSDFDRLQAALATLRGRGYLVAERWGDCGTCLGGEVFPEIDRLKLLGSCPRAWVGFHSQDTEDLGTSSDHIYLSFGVGDDEADGKSGDVGAAAVAAEVIAVFAQVGLATDWDGDVGRRIMVRLPDWRMPLRSWAEATQTGRGQ